MHPVVGRAATVVAAAFLGLGWVAVVTPAHAAARPAVAAPRVHSFPFMRLIELNESGQQAVQEANEAAEEAAEQAREAQEEAAEQAREAAEEQAEQNRPEPNATAPVDRESSSGDDRDGDGDHHGGSDD